MSTPGSGLPREGLGHLLADKRLQVPFFQRAYSWKKSHVTDLLFDIGREIDGNGASYFLGSIVALPLEDGAIEVVDGQQRLATTAILLAAIRDHLFSIKHDEQAHDLERDYLLRKHGFKEQKVQPTLTLGELDNDFFRKRVLSRPGTKERSTKPARESHRRIADACDLASKHVSAIVAGRPVGDQLAILDKWVDFVRNKAQVIFISVPDHAEASVIFETLNDRGLELSIADLTKNYLFGKSKGRVNEAKMNWERMSGTLSAVSDSDITKYFIHSLWSSLNGVTRDREVFKSIRGKITGEQAAVDFSAKLAESAVKYAALRNAEHEMWHEYGPNSRKNVRVLASSLRVTQIATLLLAAVEHLDKRCVQKLLRCAVCWSVRFLIAGGSPGNLESYYSSHAVRIRRGELKKADEVIASMIELVPTDEQFAAAFATESTRTSHRARYYLQCLELAFLDESDPHLGEDDETKGSLEHILPKNPDPKFWTLSADEHEALLWRLGNLALLGPADNSKRGNTTFSNAKKMYSGASFGLTQEIAKIPGKDWNEDTISKRQKMLSNYAVKAWPLK